MRKIKSAVCILLFLALQPFELASAQEFITETVTYGNEDVRLPGILVRPAAIEGRAPAVFALHGGGNSGLQRAMVWLAERLAQRGYVVLSGTYRVAPGRTHDLADAQLAIDYLSSLDYVDASRIGMTGQSRGAGNSYRVGAADPRVKAIMPIATNSTASVTGVEDRLAGDTRMLSEQRYMERIRGAGGYPEERAGMADPPETPPFPSIWDIDVPVLVLHGTLDVNAPAEGAIMLREEIKKRDVQHIHVNLIAGMGHFFDTPKGPMLDEIGALAADWFDTHLRGIDTGRDFEAPLTLPDAPSWPGSDAYSVAAISYPAGTAEVQGYLATPVRSNGRGVVYAPGGHSGAEASRLSFVVDSLASDGYTVLITRYRQEKADTTDEADIAGALAVLAGKAGIDGDRLAVVGHGRGGMAALRSAARNDAVKAVVALGAPANVTRLMRGLEAYSPASAGFMAARMAGPDRYRELSPQYLARDITVPVLLIHGTLDLTVAPEHMLWNAIALKTTGNTQVETYMPPWDIHHFDSTFAWLEPDAWASRIPDFLNSRIPD
jgi:dipeptidyl aminopeptidase/acylaminoacyl peptidase